MYPPYYEAKHELTKKLNIEMDLANQLAGFYMRATMALYGLQWIS